MARPREVFEAALTIVGILLILIPVLLVTDSYLVIGLVVLGLLSLEAGLWGVAARVMPEAREFSLLRERTDEFLEGVRKLNRHAVEGDEEAVARQRIRLREHVDVLVEAAGRRD